MLPGTEYDIVVISNETSVYEGNSTELVCTVFYQRDVNIVITWLRAGVPVQNSSENVIIEQDMIQGSRQFRTSFLQICSVLKSAVYTCSVSNGTGTEEESVVLNILFDGECRKKSLYTNFIALSRIYNLVYPIFFHFH